jgi:hypothetical protein
MRPALNMKERRTAERYPMRGEAKIQTPDSRVPRNCLVTDVSDAGVRLYVEGPALPDEFVLIFARDGARRDCRVVWRLGHELGVEFTDIRQSGFARRMAG